MALRRKILFIEDPIPGLGGAQRSLLGILEHLPRDRFEPWVASHPLPEFVTELGRLKVPHRPIDPKGYRLAFVMRGLRPGIVHGNAPTEMLTLNAGLAARMLGVPFVWHVRIAEDTGWKDRLLASLSTRIICISEFVAQKFIPIRDPSKIRVVHNACDVRRFRPMGPPRSIRARLDLTPNLPLVGTVNRLDPGKGLLQFLEAFRIVAARHRGARAIIVGGGDSRHLDELRRYVREAKLEARVTLSGEHAAFEDVPRWMNAMDVFVHSSTVPEPFGRVIIEAMACGRPVVAFDHGASREIISDGRDGYLAAPSRADALAHWISRLLEDAATRKRMSEHARQTAENRFDVHRLVGNMTEIYHRLVSG